MNDKTTGVILAALSAFLIGSNFVIAKHLFAYIDFRTQVLYWFGIASILLFLIILFRKDVNFFGNLKKDIKAAAIIGVVNFFTALLFFSSLELLNSSFFAFLMRLATVTTAVMGVLFLKESFTKIEAAGAIIAIIGTFILTYAPEHFTYAVLLGVIAALAIGVQDFFWKTFLKRIHPLTINFYRVFGITVLMLLYLLVTGGLQKLPAQQLPLLVLGAVLSPVLGVLFLLIAMKKLEVSKVVAIRTIEPFIVVVYAFLFFGTLPSLNEWIGGIIVVIGVSIMTLFHHAVKRVNGMLVRQKSL